MAKTASKKPTQMNAKPAGYSISTTDHISKAFKKLDLVPVKYKGTENCWTSLEKPVQTSPSSRQLKDFLALKQEVSDHMPLLTRFILLDERE